MLHEFLHANRMELAERCRTKVAARHSPPPSASGGEGVPVLIEQLTSILRAAQNAGGVEAATLSPDICQSATRHGGDLLRRGFTVDQVVHDYGDLCQAVTELASEKRELISVDEFHTFNRCLDAAIAGAVTEFGRQRDDIASEVGESTLNERLGSLAHELRNLLGTAKLAYAAIKTGQVAVTGATGNVLDRSLDGLSDLIDRALADVRVTTGLHARLVVTALDDILEEVRVAAKLDASARGIRFTTSVAPDLRVTADRQMLSSALANLLQNAFKYSRPAGHVSLTARVVDGRVLIDIADECGGLPAGSSEEIFQPFAQRNKDQTGVGLGLSISRRAVEINGGALTVRDVPGTGCVFTIDIPQT
jgi:signal transduction histidine kinase